MVSCWVRFALTRPDSSSCLCGWLLDTPIAQATTSKATLRVSSCLTMMFLIESKTWLISPFIELMFPFQIFLKDNLIFLDLFHHFPLISSCLIRKSRSRIVLLDGLTEDDVKKMSFFVWNVNVMFGWMRMNMLRFSFNVIFTWSLFLINIYFLGSSFLLVRIPII